MRAGLPHGQQMPIPRLASVKLSILLIVHTSLDEPPRSRPAVFESRFSALSTLLSLIYAAPSIRLRQYRALSTSERVLRPGALPALRMKGEYDAFDGLRLSVAMSRQARAGGFFNGTATMELGEHTEAILTGNARL